MSGPVRFDAAVKGHPRSVSFYVDGKHLWTDRSRPYAFGRRGVIDTSLLVPGLHRLTVEARYRRGKRRRASIRLLVARNGRALPTNGNPPGAESPGRRKHLPPAGSVLWRGDFETGDFSQWEGLFQAAPGRASVVTSPHIQGSYAGRFEVREGEFIGSDAPTRNRTEAYVSPLAGRHNPREGDDWWYSWWFYLPSTTPIPAAGSPPTFMIITQWASSAPASSPDFELNGVLEFRDIGGPGVGLNYSDGGSRSDGVATFWHKTASSIDRDAWHRMVIHKKWSSNEAVGFVEIWYDDAKQTLTDGTTKMFMRTLKAGYSARMHQGIYRSNAIGGTAVIYSDGLRIGTTRESVGN